MDIQTEFIFASRMLLAALIGRGLVKIITTKSIPRKQLLPVVIIGKIT